MKNLLIILLSLLSFNAFSYTLDTIQAKSEITDVTVFLSGAEVVRNVELDVNRGEYLIIIDELPVEINTQSIQVKGMANCKILSVKHQIKYKDSGAKTSKELEIEDIIETKTIKRRKVQNQSAVYVMEEKLLIDNSNLARGDDGSSINEIKEAADYYRIRLNEIRLAKLNLSIELEKIDKEINEMYGQLNKLAANVKDTYSQVLVSIDCETEVQKNMILSYYVWTAGWMPLYDFRVEDITKPLTIVYNANVFQSSGEDWNNVNITLSTSNPSLSGSKPELSIWNLGYRRTYSQNTQYQQSSGMTSGTLQGKVIDKTTWEELPFVNIVLQASGRQQGGTASDIDGKYIIKPIPPGKYDVRVTAIGYATTIVTGIQINANQTRFFDIEMDPSAIMLDANAVVIREYVVPLIDKDKTVSGGTVTQEEIQRMPNRSVYDVPAATIGGVYSVDGEASNIRGSRSDDQIFYYDGNIGGNEIQTSNYIANTASKRVTNLEYEIEIPYSIPSDGEDYGIKIKEVSLPVDYVDYAIPKLELSAFLTADIANWTDLDLLSGKTSIYYQGTFTGESYINSNLTKDTLSVSLSRDDEVVITREGNKEMNDRRIIGNNIKETIGWDITIRNNKNAKTKMIIEDQIPISERKSVVVELLESSDARYEEKTGKLSWEIEIEPGEKKVLTFKYSVRYPQYENIVLE